MPTYGVRMQRKHSGCPTLTLQSWNAFSPRGSVPSCRHCLQAPCLFWHSLPLWLRLAWLWRNYYVLNVYDDTPTSLNNNTHSSKSTCQHLVFRASLQTGRPPLRGGPHNNTIIITTTTTTTTTTVNSNSNTTNSNKDLLRWGLRSQGR